MSGNKVEQPNTYRLIRLYNDLTMVEVAEALNVGTGTINIIENGHRSPTREIRAKYARVFPITNEFIEFCESYEKMR